MLLGRETNAVYIDMIFISRWLVWRVLYRKIQEGQMFFMREG